MRFLAPATILSYVAMAPTQDYLAAAGAALDGVTEALAADLRTDFDLVTQCDTFLPNWNTPFFKLKLTQGFLTANPQVIVMSTPSAPGTTTAVQLTETNTGSFAYFNFAQPVDVTKACTFDLVKGVIAITGIKLSGQTVLVNYTAGFGPDATDPTLYDQTKVPGWLTQLANIRTRIVLADHPAFIESKAVYDQKSLHEQYGTSIARRVRYTPDAITSQFSGPVTVT